MRVVSKVCAALFVEEVGDGAAQGFEGGFVAGALHVARVDGDGGIEFACTQRAAPHGEEQDHDEGAQEGAEQARGEGTEERHGRGG